MVFSLKLIVIKTIVVNKIEINEDYIPNSLYNLYNSVKSTISVYSNLFDKQCLSDRHLNNLIVRKYVLLEKAARLDDVKIVKYLIEKYNIKVYNNLLTYALVSKSNSVINYLIRHNKSDIENYNDILICAIKYNNHVDIIKYLIEKYNIDIHTDNDQPLRYAAFYSCLEVVKYLVESGANVNANNGGPVKNAIFGSKLDILNYLINECNVNINTYDLLHEAMRSKDLNMVIYITDNYNVFPNIQDLIDLCIVPDQPKIFKYLIEKYNIDIHQNNDELMISAVDNNIYDIIKYLIDKGADANIYLQTNKFISEEMHEYLKSKQVILFDELFRQNNIELIEEIFKE